MSKRKSVLKCDLEPEYTYEQVAEAMNVHVMTLQRAASRGELIVQRYAPNCVRILKSDVEAFRRKHRLVVEEEAK
jgi:excisionase family DNA binding protein